jgi:hypothetical protein
LIDSAAFYDQNLTRIAKNSKNHTTNNVTDFTIRIREPTTTSPQMNGHCERVIQSIQTECTDQMIFLGERMLRYALKEYQNHYNAERHHQGIENRIPFPQEKKPPSTAGEIKCKTRLGGLLRKYYRDTAA